MKYCKWIRQEIGVDETLKRHFLITVIALALIAFAFAPALAQEIDCTEEFFRVSRREGSCQDFFVCMIGGRVDFSCDAGHIFDEDRIACRPGDTETCQFISPEIPADACVNDFLRMSPHPDPEQCWVFFVCLNYNTIVFRCDPGYIYADWAQRCVPGSHVTCEEEGMTPYKKLMASIRKN